jgi:glutathione-regulated potassium-efflux system ancillary protein KefG
MSTAKKTLWNLFHPNLSASTGNKIIAEKIQEKFDTTFVDHYAEYGDFNIDVAKEQQRLTDHDLLVFQCPFYWYSTPPLFKKWQDDVLTYGFAYPPKEGNKLHGKHMLVVFTTGGPMESYKAGGYNNFTMSELLRPLQQTAVLCGMKWLPPQVIHSVLPGDYDGIKASKNEQIESFADELATYINEYDLAHERSLKPLNSPYFQK